jgi:hypothetical protein
MQPIFLSVKSTWQSTAASRGSGSSQHCQIILPVTSINERIYH